ncbi:hypothetical protein D3C71_25120 [compost metagenome]
MPLVFALSCALALAAGIASMAAILVPVILDESLQATFLSAGGYFLASMAVSSVAMYLVFVVSLLLLTPLVRGRSAVGWIPPSQCKTLGSWITFDWNFLGSPDEKGQRRQTGLRFLGFEVAWHGSR